MTSRTLVIWHKANEHTYWPANRIDLFSPTMYKVHLTYSKLQSITTKSQDAIILTIYARNAV